MSKRHKQALRCLCLSCIDLRLELSVNKVFAAIKVG